MKDLTPVGSSFPAPRSVETGDELNEANLDEAFQAAADRAQYLAIHLASLENVILGDGCPKLAVVATSAAMKALEDVATGELRLCLQTPTAFGIYVRVGIGSLPADLPGVAYASTVEAGYWLNVTSPLVTTGGHDGAQPRLNSAVVRVPNRVEDPLRFNSAEVDLGESASWQDILTSGALSLYAGDKVVLTFTSSAKNSDSANPAGVRLAVTNPTPSTADAGTSALTYDFYADNKRIHVGTQAVFTVAATGNHTFRAQALLSPGGGPYNVVFGGPSMQVTIIRP